MTALAVSIVVPSLKARLLDHARELSAWLGGCALPLWWRAGADHTRGGYHDMLDETGSAVPGPRRARVQARQSFVFAEAWRLGYPGDWRPAAAHGVDYMRAHFRRSDGLFRTLVSDGGAPLDDAAYLYDQAFFMLATAALNRISPHGAHLRDEAEALLSRVARHLAHDAGGFREAGPHPFQANAHMHLLEAALAWAEAGGGACWRALAGQVIELALSRFIDPVTGALHEHFAGDWRPSLGADGRLVEPGHQFEWAWLITQWSARTHDHRLRPVARRLFAAGKAGVDASRKLAIDEMDGLSAARSRRARLWPQTEYLRSALALASIEPDNPAYLADALEAADAVRAYLDVNVLGLWRDKHLPDGRFVDEPSPASSLYHIFGAVSQLTAWSVKEVRG